MKASKQKLNGIPPELTIWDVAVSLGVPRPLMGKWIKENGETAVAEMIGRMAVKRPADPCSWGTAFLQDRPKNQIPRDPNEIESWARDNGHPMPKVGETSWDYRKRIERELSNA